MIHHIVLYKLRPELTAEEIENFDPNANAAPENSGCNERAMWEADRQKQRMASVFSGRIRFKGTDGHVQRGSRLH